MCCVWQADPDLARLVGEAPEAYAAAGGADGARPADATPRAPAPPARDLLSASPYEEELSEAEELVLTPYQQQKAGLNVPLVPAAVGVALRGGAQRGREASADP